MFNPTRIVIDAYVERLKSRYGRVYGVLEPDFPGILSFVGRIALENIANSDAPYHDLNHTLLVTEVGQEILLGKQLSEGGVSPADWLHFVTSLLCHDIGYVRGVCKGDSNGRYVLDAAGATVELPLGSTDAGLTPYHISRGKLFVAERFANVPQIDKDVILANIEYTRFPVPVGDSHRETGSFPGLLRAADLIGQMADLDYLRKSSALFCEFRETGAADKLGYRHPDDLRSGYPGFFWGEVRPYLDDALRYLGVTQEGKAWVNNLYANVFVEEHKAPAGAG